MKTILILAMAALLPGCAAVSLPTGSYLEGSAGYSKDDGYQASAVIHIPLSRGAGQSGRLPRPAGLSK